MYVVDEERMSYGKMGCEYKSGGGGGKSVDGGW